MSPLSRRPFRIALVAGGLLLAPGLATAQAVDDATKAALQSVVSRQLDAIAHDDAAKAEALAAPAIQEKFHDPAGFLAMVKEHYGALVKPRGTRFTGVEDSPHGPLQKVIVVAADGTVWSAIYSFEKVGDEWRITGCGLEQSKDEQAI